MAIELRPLVSPILTDTAGSLSTSRVLPSVCCGQLQMILDVEHTVPSGFVCVVDKLACQIWHRAWLLVYDRVPTLQDKISGAGGRKGFQRMELWLLLIPAGICASRVPSSVNSAYIVSCDNGGCSFADKGVPWKCTTAAMMVFTLALLDRDHDGMNL